MFSIWISRTNEIDIDGLRFLNKSKTRSFVACRNWCRALFRIWNNVCSDENWWFWWEVKVSVTAATMVCACDKPYSKLIYNHTTKLSWRKHRNWSQHIFVLFSFLISPIRASFAYACVPTQIKCVSLTRISITRYDDKQFYFSLCLFFPAAPLCYFHSALTLTASITLAELY